MVFRPKIDPRLAFVLMPFEPPFESYYEEIIRPAAKLAGLETRKADEIYSTGPIIHDIWKQIWAATAVIADVTGKNPNVNYELGICHTLGVPTVIITQNWDDVPFDYRHRRCIRYETDKVDWQRQLKKSITATLKEVIAGENVFPELGWPYDTSPSGFSDRASPLIPATDGRDMVVRGARIVRDAVAYAFGPHGAHVSVSAGPEQRRYYRKGSAIAGSIHASGRLDEIGSRHASDLSREMRDSVGDGSKAAILLFQEMLERGSLALRRNYAANEVLRGMERATELLVSGVTSQSTPVNRQLLTQVARTAAGGNQNIAELTVEAYAKAGRDGVIVIEQSNLLETVLEVQEGMSFDQGYIDTALLTASEAQECTLQNPYILAYDRKISSMRDLLPILEQVLESKRPLLIVADDIEGEALATIVLNRKNGVLDCIAVKAPGFGDRRKALLQDIAVVTAGSAITMTTGRGLANVTLQDLGSARKVVVTKEETTILGGAGESNVGQHAEAIREEISRKRDPYEIEKLRERLAKLTGAIAFVRIGGISPQDLVDDTYRAESAMHSVRKAIEEGCVPGGGVSLLRAKSALAKLSFKKPGEIEGLNIIANFVEQPIRQLLLNSRVDTEDMLRRIKRARASGTGFNPETGRLQDLRSAGVLDPTATITRAVRLAFSHARTLLETAAWDSGVPETEREQGQNAIQGGQRTEDI